MWKIFLVTYFIVFEVSLCDPIPNIQNNILEQMLDSLPISKTKEISEKHLREDPGFQAAIRYLHSSEWQKIVEDVKNAPDWVAYKEFLKASGLNINPLIAHMTHCLNATKIEPSVTPTGDVTTPSLESYIDDLRTELLIPLMTFAGKLTEKSGGVEAFPKIFSAASSGKAKELLENAIRSDEMQIALDKISDLGVNVDKLIEFVYALFNWQPKHYKDF